MEDSDRRPSELGWGRAAFVAVAVAVAGVALLVVVPNLIVTKWTALVHSARVAIAVVWFFASLIAICIFMRFMQRHQMI